MIVQAAAAQGAPAQTTDAPSTGGAISAVGAITTIHFILIGTLALLVTIGILYGMRLKRQRTKAEGEERKRMDELAAPAPSDATPGAEERRVPSPATQSVAPAPVVERVEASQPGANAPEPGGDGPAAGPVSQLKGLGPKVAARLGELGITRVGQIAALTDDEAEALDAKLGPFQGRLARDRWIEQARFLAAGDKAGFEAVFGRL